MQQSRLRKNTPKQSPVAFFTTVVYKDREWTPLHLAASFGWKRCCQLFLEAGYGANDRTMLEETPLHVAAYSGHKGVVKLLLKYGANILLEDEYGNNCLDLAIKRGHKEIALEILSDRDWETALRKNMRRGKDFAVDTPLRKMIRYMPDIAEHVLDKCARNESAGDYSEVELPHNYEFIDDTFGYDLLPVDRSKELNLRTEIEELKVYTAWGRVKKGVTPYTRDREFLKLNHPLMLMVNYRREKLLCHPLCKRLLNHKWRNYVRYVYFGNLFIFVSFLESPMFKFTLPDTFPICKLLPCGEIRVKSGEHQDWFVHTEANAQGRLLLFHWSASFLTIIENEMFTIF